MGKSRKLVSPPGMPVILEERQKEGQRMRRSNGSARLLDGCMLHRKLTLLEAFKRSLPKGQLRFRRRVGLNLPVTDLRRWERHQFARRRAARPDRRSSSLSPRRMTRVIQQSGSLGTLSRGPVRTDGDMGRTGVKLL